MRWWWTLVVALLASCANSDIAEESPSPTIELFGEGAISTEAPEFAIAFTPDGDTAFFNRVGRVCRVENLNSRVSRIAVQFAEPLFQGA